MVVLWSTPTALSSISRVSVRCYAVSVAPSRVYERKPVPRRYGERKSYLYDQYTRMLQDSDRAPMILLQHKDFDTRRLQLLRREIDAVNARFTLSGDTTRPSTPPRLTVMRTSIFGVALRDLAPSSEMTNEVVKLVEGGFAVLTLPSLNPPQLNALIRAIDRVVPPKKAVEKDTEKGQRGRDEDADFVPGRARPRVRPRLSPQLKVMGALIEGQTFTAKRVQEVASLPTLDTLRAQIAGLVNTPAMRLAGILSETSGGKLVRTLEGLRKGLEEESR